MLKRRFWSLISHTPSLTARMSARNWKQLLNAFSFGKTKLSGWRPATRLILSSARAAFSIIPAAGGDGNAHTQPPNDQATSHRASCPAAQCQRVRILQLFRAGLDAVRRFDV